MVSEETENEKATEQEGRKIIDIALANPAVAHALSSGDHQAMAHELRTALKVQHQKQTVPREK